jgi:SHS2 domain-containing protein
MEKPKTTTKFKFFPHTGDVKFQAYGKTMKEAFENIALAISHIFSRGKGISSKKKRKIKTEGEDTLSMLYNFMEELIFLVDSDNFVVSEAKVKISGNKLKAEISGDDASNYDLDQIKSPTYAEMYVEKTSKGWEAQAVVDV